MADIVEINELKSLGSYRLVWDSLFADTPGATFLHTYDWFENYWRHFGSDQRMRVLVARAAGDVIGIVPLCVKRRVHRLGSYRVATYPLDDWSAFYSPIGKNQMATLLMAMRHLADSPRDWDEIELPGVATTIDHGRSERALAQARLAPHCHPHCISSIIELESSGGWRRYLDNLPRKVRHELRRTLRRVEEWGDVEFIRHRPQARRAGDGDPRWDLYDTCEQIASASWQADSRDGNTLCHPQFAAFYRDSHAAAARLGMADMAVLKLAGRPVAFWIGFHYEGRVFGLRMGYRSDAPLGGVGTTLLARLIEDSFARGDRLLDLGPGDEKYKARLRTTIVPSYRLTHTPRTSWKPQLMRASHWLHDRLTAS